MNVVRVFRGARPAGWLITPLVLTGSVVGQGARDPRLPEGLLDRVTRAVAQEWAVPPRAVVLNWGVVRDTSRLRDSTTFALRGGQRGQFVVAFDRPGRPPFAVHVKAGVRRLVPAAGRRLRRGEVLTDEDVRLVEVVQWGNPPPPEAQPGAGWRVHRHVEAGQILAPPAVVPPPDIDAGDLVRLSWRRGPITVVVEGVAMHQATTGQPIRIRLVERGGSARGIVTGRGRARFDYRGRS